MHRTRKTSATLFALNYFKTLPRTHRCICRCVNSIPPAYLLSTYSPCVSPRSFSDNREAQLETVSLDRDELARSLSKHRALLISYEWMSFRSWRRLRASNACQTPRGPLKTLDATAPATVEGQWTEGTRRADFPAWRPPAALAPSIQKHPTSHSTPTRQTWSVLACCTLFLRPAPPERRSPHDNTAAGIIANTSLSGTEEVDCLTGDPSLHRRAGSALICCAY